jgi:aminoglycoside phosphotransferase family enzyme/predicted kinase
MTSPTTQDTVNQQEVFDFLADPATHADADVRRIDTHAAVVFLAGDRALKVKRAIRFPFLDYSTLAKRKASCEEEIRINRPSAPQIYRRVVAITQGHDGSLSIDGDGRPVEYAVEMTRFDERLTLDHLAQAGALDPALIVDLADAIATSHRTASVVTADRWIRSLPSIIADNTSAFHASGCLPANTIDKLDARSLTELSRVRACLRERGRLGLVRRCHGDLHLANIVLIGHKPVLFDAIEFDPVIASIDILYDLSFTMMDLLRYGRRLEANILLNRYLTTTLEDNFDGITALPLFMSIRAAIRANVLLARLGGPSADRPNTDEATIRLSARSYFDLAQQLILPSPPTLVAIGGLSGTGKTVLARALADAIEPPPGAVILRSDITRKEHFRVHETQRLPPIAYQPEANSIIYQNLTERAERILSQGHSVILDAVFAKPAERNSVAAIARKLSLPFIGLFLVSDLTSRLKRVGHRVGDASDATLDLVRHQETYDIGSLDWDVINASGTPQNTLQRCKKALGMVEIGFSPKPLDPP